VPGTKPEASGFSLQRVSCLIRNVKGRAAARPLPIPTAFGVVSSTMTNDEAIDSLMNSARNLELITRSRHLQKVHIGLDLA
jgi:hypothetical protein